MTPADGDPLGGLLGDVDVDLDTDEELADRIGARPVRGSSVVFDGRIWDVVREEVDLGAAGTVTREFVAHPGAVGVLALDDAERVLVIQQYRHPVGAEVWELPAGLLDVAGEDPAAAAARELHEEADVVARRYDVLVDLWSSPGGSGEAVRLYLGRDCAPAPEDGRHEREAEEADMPTRWVPLDELRDAILAGRLHNSLLVAGVLAACAAREGDWSSLRPADAPWPEHRSQRQ
ncbi:NUDIX domain-containing protein [Janibacter sp. G1551]|uniref:NUDIX domain-containing protein n=1 Tax=Janibacter sp. G1551 TaxID=3420440 RepID=UPI003D082A87